MVNNMKQLIYYSSLSIFLLLSFNANSSECGVMQLKTNRSSGITVTANKCTEQSYVSMGTVFNLSSKGRLWLSSNPQEGADTEFQMICQNRSKNDFRLEFSDLASPWLSQESLKNCTGWVKNRLQCDGSNGEKNGVMCVLNITKVNKSNQLKRVQRTTSVKMRAITQLIRSEPVTVVIDKTKIIDTLTPEINLCKKLYQSDQMLTVNWAVQEAKAKNIKIMLSDKQSASKPLESCVKMVVETTSYPDFSEKTTFLTTF